MAKSTSKASQAPEPVISTEPSFLSKLASNFKLNQWLVLGLAVTVYANSLLNNFAVDDIMLITGNMYGKRGAAGIGGFFKYDTFYGFFNDSEKEGSTAKSLNVVAGGRYRPLTPAMFALETSLLCSHAKDAEGKAITDKDGYQTYDMYASSLSIMFRHFINVALYGLLCWLIYRFLLLLLNPHRTAERDAANWMALVTALLFATHPLHTEAVANIKGRDEIITLLGCIAAAYWTLLAYYKPEKKTIYLASAAAVFFVASLAKETTVTFLAVVPLCFWFFTDAKIKDIALLTMPLLVSFVLFFGLRQSVIGGAKLTGFDTDELMNDPFIEISPQTTFAPIGEGSTLRYVSNPSTETYVPMSTGTRMATMLESWLTYQKLLLFPHPLTNDYYPRHIERKTMSDGSAMIALLLHLGILGIGLYGFKQRKGIIAFGALYYLATFSIVSNLVFPVGTNMSERFMFMPSVGWLLALSAILYWLGKKVGETPVMGFIGILLLFFSFKTVIRNKAWENDRVLFFTDIEVSKNSAKLNNAVGSTLFDDAMKAEGEHLKANPNDLEGAKRSRHEKLRKAISHLETALTIHPTYPAAWLLYGNCKYYLADEDAALAPGSAGKPVQALQNYNLALSAYERVLTFRPDHEDVPRNKGVIYRDMGKIYGEKYGDLAKSIDYLKKSLTIQDKDSETWKLYGTAMGVSGNAQEAVKAFEKSLEIRPDNPAAQENLAVAYRQVGQFGKAEEQLLKVLELYKTIPKTDPGYKQTLFRTYQLLIETTSAAGKGADAARYRNEQAAL